MGASDFGAAVVQTLLDVFEPVEDALESPEAFAKLMLRMGWTVPADTDFLQAITDVIGTGPLLQTARDLLQERRTSTELTEEEVGQLIDSGVAIIEALRALVGRSAPTSISFPLDQQAFWDSFPADLLQELFIAFLEDRHPSWFAVLYLLGIIDDVPVAADPAVGRLEHVKRILIWSRLATLVGSPGQLATDVYGWGGNLQSEKLLSRISAAMHALGLPARLRLPGHGAIGDYYDPGPDLDSLRQLEVPLFHDRLGDGAFAEVALVAFPIPPTGSQTGPANGLFIGPLLRGAAGTDLPLGGPFVLKLRGGFESEGAFGIELRPGKVGARLGSPVTTFDVAAELAVAPAEPLALLPSRTPPNVLLTDLSVAIELKGTSADLELRLAFRTSRLDLQISPGGGDGLLSKIFGESPFSIDLAAGVGWSSKYGLIVEGTGGLAVSKSVNITLGPVHISEIQLAVRPGTGVSVTLGVTGTAALGPVIVSVQDVGTKIALEPTAPGASGTFGDLDVDVGFKFPSGVGIAVSAGAISGGGFLTFEPDIGRYTGAVELSVYGVAVKAFGIIETQFPDGHKGFSFVIVISAEFANPIQLGFGFTLNGVGGLIGINRTVDPVALLDLVTHGKAEHLLFPKNVIANAPAIIRDLGTVFPTREGRYLFGPLARLGWGTPTLIRGDLGLILELPGPTLTIIGEIQSLLPKPETPLVKFNLSVGGYIDFANKTFALDAFLHDSVINGYPVSGQMAMRLRWGDNPSFALSIGGFHPAFQAPANFPKTLQPLTIVLAQKANVSATVSGFFAITPNTLQVGGVARLHASGGDISLDASLSVKAIFVFSPFSFVANIDASVKISFHGYGPSVHLTGLLSGPSPWRVKGEVCVSIIWWDACLGFDETFGGKAQVPEVELDPWLGSANVVGLQAALQDPKNWSAVPPSGSFAVVSLAPGADSLVDPMGGFSVRQKVVPLEQTKTAVTRLGTAKAVEPGRTDPIFYRLADAKLAGAEGALAKLVPPTDFFAPAQFFEMNEAKKLSAKSFDKYQAGYSLSAKPNNIDLGSSAPNDMIYQTVILGTGGVSTAGDVFELPVAHLTAFSTRNAVARGGFTQDGIRKFVDPTTTQPFAIADVGFVLTKTTDLSLVNPTEDPLTRTDALVALDAHIALFPEQRGRVQIVPTHELVPV